MKYLALSLFILSGLLAYADGRTWTDAQGRSFAGELISQDGATAQIRKSVDQRVYAIPVAQLSQADQSYLREQRSAPPATTQTPNYELKRFNIALKGNKPQTVTLSVKYNNRIVWQGEAEAPGSVEVELFADTDFNEPSWRGRDGDERIFLYVESATTASQWHYIEQSGSTLKLRHGNRITLYPKKYVVIEYAFYQGEDPNFTDRVPTHSGTAVVGHWGTLPGVGRDWQVWQAGDDNELWGDRLLLDYHTGDGENGMAEARRADFSKLTKAPNGGYVHYGACGEPRLEAKAGETYYTCVTNVNSVHGYGKIRIVDVTDTAPEGIPLIEDTSRL